MIQSPAGYQGDVRIKRYLDFYQAGYGVAMLSSGTTAFTPASLFAASEPGGWYDPSDLTTLYQDAAGTTPVTAVEQPVGLVLDKSRGLVLGSETSPALSAYITELTGTWAASGANYAFTDTVGGQVRPGVQWPSVSLTPGWYRVVVVVASITGATQIRMDGVGASDQLLTTGTNTRTVLVTVNSRPRLRLEDTSTTIGDGFAITSVSIRELPGAHLSQSTAAARPVLSARVNLLTYTEQFDNAAWVKNAILAFGSGSVANAIAAPNGTTTADFVVPTATTAEHYLDSPSVTFTSGVAYTFSAYAKTGGYSWFRLAFSNSAFAAAGRAAWFNISNGTLGTVQSGVTASITDVGDGWYRCSITATANATGTFANFLLIVNADNTTSFAANGTSGIYIWGADLRPANAGVGLPSYQRVGAATDYDTTGFPLYLKFDGTDDFLQSSTITPGSVDKAQVFAGVRKLSDAAFNFIAEYSPVIASNNGAFFIRSEVTTGEWRYSSKGTVQSLVISSAQVAPVTRVVSGLGDISGDLATIRVDGVQAGQSTTDQGTGNYGSYPLYVGCRYNAPPTTPSQYFLNGHLYSLILRFGANLDAATITATETWVNQRTKAF